MVTRSQDRQGHAEPRRKNRAELPRDQEVLIVEVAERLFRQLGYQKTTVADIARELHMSPADVYRFFGAKSEINAAVCMDLLGKIEAEAGKIAASRGTALQKMRNLVVSVEKAHYKQYMFDRKLHELIEAVMTENWTIMREHNHRMTGMLEQIIASGMVAGEFRPGDAALTARLVNAACSRFYRPLIVEQEPEPTLDQMIDFCLSALDNFCKAAAESNLVKPNMARDVGRLRREADLGVEFAASVCAGHDVKDFDEELAERLLNGSLDRLTTIVKDVSDLAAETAIDLAVIETKRIQIDRAQAENWAQLRELTEQAQ